MARTITAYFDTHEHAEAARQRLDAANLGVSAAIHHGGADAASHREGHGEGFWAGLKNAILPDEDRHVYEEGVRRGGAVLTMEAADDQVAGVVAILEGENSVDIDQRAADWRAGGWDHPGGPTTTGGAIGAAAGMASAPTGGFSGERSLDYDTDGASAHRTDETGTENAAAAYARRDPAFGGKVRSYFSSDYAQEPDYAHGGRGSATAHGVGATAGGLADEVIGNVKQGIGRLTGDDALRAEGRAQEDRGEMRQGDRERY